MGIFAVAFIILYVSRLPEPHKAGEKREGISIAGAFRHRNFTFGVIAIFCYVGIEVGIANWTLQYVENSPAVNSCAMAPATIAGSVAGVYWLLMLVGRLIGGAVGNRISSRAMLTVTSAVAICLLVIGIYMPETSTDFFGFNATELSFFSVQIPANAIFMILCGLCTSVMWGAIFNLSVEGLGKYTAVASGLFMAMVCGGGILPFIQGLIAKDCGILAGFWLTVAAAAYILMYALILSRPKKA
ncbi:fucose permease [Prevotella sp. CAG:873]|nr:fucose permease [Prevotella sp. CAG:873]